MLLATSDIAREVDRAFLLIGGVSVLLLAGITIAMVALAVRYRRGAVKTTSQIEGHTWLEVVWIVIPTLLVTWMFFVGYEGFTMMRSVPEGAMVVEVTGQQWMWSFHYPEEKLNTGEMVVPVDMPVKVELTAPPNDVVHSFFIPDFRVKEDAVPGKDTYLWFQAEREGTYNIFCAEFCGKDHSTMIANLRVVNRAEYDEWVAAEHMKRYEPVVAEAFLDPGHPKFGEEGLDIDAVALYGNYCQSCHGASGDGSGLPGVARDFTVAEGWKKSSRASDVFRTLTEGVEESQMRAFPNITPWERLALVHHVRSLVGDTVAEDTPEEIGAVMAEYGLDKVQAPAVTIPVERAMEIMAAEAEVD